MQVPAYLCSCSSLTCSLVGRYFIHSETVIEHLLSAGCCSEYLGMILSNLLGNPECRPFHSYFTDEKTEA